MEKVSSQFTLQHEAIGFAKQFHTLREERFTQRHFIRKFFIVLHFAVQKGLVFKPGPSEVVGNLRIVRIQSIGIVSLLFFDVLHFNIRKN